jgi:nucleoside-diphosphate kinase
MKERTLSMIKPDAVKKNAIGAIVEMLEKGGLKVVGARMLRLSRAQAEGFYAVHKERPFFGSLCEFMSSGPIMAMVLEGENAIARNREVMGVTDSAKAAEGTIRRRFGTNIEHNAVHGSDAPETARAEIAYFFSPYELNGLGW